VCNFFPHAVSFEPVCCNLLSCCFPLQQASFFPSGYPSPLPLPPFSALHLIGWKEPSSFSYYPLFFGFDPKFFPKGSLTSNSSHFHSSCFRALLLKSVFFYSPSFLFSPPPNAPCDDLLLVAQLVTCPFHLNFASPYSNLANSPVHSIPHPIVYLIFG